jgi:hypothetical protein
METEEEADFESLQLSIRDEATEKLLESDEDETKALQRYDRGDPQFMSKVHDDMCKLDFLLQERLTYQKSLRKKRKRHLKKLHQTLSEFQMIPENGRQGGRHEVENTRKFLSATDLQYQASRHQVEAVAPNDLSLVDSFAASATVTTTSKFSESLVSIPKPIHPDEPGHLEYQSAVVPSGEIANEIGSYLDQANFNDQSNFGKTFFSGWIFIFRSFEIYHNVSYFH